ncbi:MAG: hypothetical protein NDJ24_09930 [Alphaproteobacteria bacterium]|nr:hypothetical protein [Alphaproteobacteria bacterium]
MNSQKLLILSVIAALLIISGAIAFVQFRSGSLTIGTPAASQDSKVVIDDIMASCTPNDKCIVVDTTCNFCCSYVAINAKSEQLYNQMFDQTCKTYKGAYCECHDLNNYPTCVNGKCQMVQWSAKPPPAPVAKEQIIAPQPLPQIPANVSPPNQPLGNLGDEPPESNIISTEDTTPAENSFDTHPPTDDLFAPLPDTYTPQTPPEAADVEVIQP